MADQKKIWVLVEYHGSSPTEASLELLSQGRLLAKELGCELWAIAPEADAGTAAVIAADQVFHSEVKTDYLGCDMGKTLAALLADHRAALVLCTMSPQGVEAAATLSVKAGFPYLTDISAISLEDGKLTLQKLLYDGLAQAVNAIEFDQPVVLGCVGGVWGIKEEAMVPETVILPQPKNKKAQISKSYIAGWQEIEVNEAAIVVAGGYGLRDQAGFAKLSPVAAALAAPVGGSRVAEDKGWIGHQAMIGATGQTIAPNLYLACGISGAIQHAVGIQNSKRIIAINNDPMAALMHNADLAVVGDAQPILAELSLLLKDYAPVKEA